MLSEALSEFYTVAEIRIIILLADMVLVGRTLLRCEMLEVLSFLFLTSWSLALGAHTARRVLTYCL